MTRGARLLPLLAGFGFEFGCASFVQGPAVSWSCVSQIAVADVKGSAFYNVDDKGRQVTGGSSSSWQWNAAERDFLVTMENLDSMPGSPAMIAFVISMPNAMFRRQVRAELRIAAVDRPQTSPRLIDRRYAQLQYNINMPTAEFDALQKSGPLYLVAVDPADAVLRAVKVDGRAITRGEAAMKMAQDRALAMTRNFRQLCTPVYGGEPPVIT